MAVLNERRFTPIAYTRGDLVEEAECLTDIELASWLDAQPDDVLDEIMDRTNDLIWFGGSYLGSLEEAMRSVHAGRPASRVGL